MPSRRPIAGTLRRPRLLRGGAEPEGRGAGGSGASNKGATPVATEAAGSREEMSGSGDGAGLFGYHFRNAALRDLALTHSSLAYESPSQDGAGDNERLEFIGDAVLGLVVAEALYRRFPDLREGELTRMRASLVSRRNLAEVAGKIGLGPLLRLGRGEEHSGGQRKPALLADALEAVIAAIYLDGGLEPAGEFVHRNIVKPAEGNLRGALVSALPISGAMGDYKSALQEQLQAAGGGQPRYILTEESGPDHQKRFRIEVRMDAPDGSSIALAEAEGTTKKQAQQEAARLALAGMAQTQAEPEEAHDERHL